MPLERKALIYRQDLLARAITVDDQPKFLRQLADVRTIVASGFELSVMPLLTKGRRVKITGGPLYGLEGFVDNASHPQGVVLSVDVLRKGLLVKVPIENLQVLPKVVNSQSAPANSACSASLRLAGRRSETGATFARLRPLTQRPHPRRDVQCRARRQRGVRHHRPRHPTRRAASAAARSPAA